MGIGTILILGACALLLGRFFPGSRLAVPVMIVSIAVTFALQPATPLRHTDFWLPALSLALTALAWAVTRASSPIRQDLVGLGVATAMILLIGLTRYLDPICCLSATRPPAFPSILIAFIAVVAIMAVPLLRPSLNRLYSWILILLLVGIFIVLKTPQLAVIAATGMRSLARQSVDQASISDITWLGFSFLAFRLIHVLRDFQTGKLPPISFPRFAAYALFFPTYVAGPIDRLPRWDSDLNTGAFDRENPSHHNFLLNLSAGGVRILIGIFKKFALADSLALFALNAQNAAQATTTGWMWLLLFGYTLRIYFDFSGYTDIAIGLGRWMGFRLPENFDHPYLKPNLTIFWNSWHITLAAWFRAYVFNPLARYLRAKSLPVGLVILISQLAVMGLIGLWHGVTTNFLIWGLWHGLGLFIHNRWSNWIRPRLEFIDEYPWRRRVLTMCGWGLTFGFVSLGWVWFALPEFDLALHVFRVLFGLPI